VTITVTFNGRPERSPRGPSKKGNLRGDNLSSLIIGGQEKVHKNLASDQIFMAKIGFCDKAYACA
jgi:hypothetical protein